MMRTRLTHSHRTLFFDAFGTLITLDHPFDRLQANLASLGHALPLSDVETAMRREFAHYIRDSRTASDAESLRWLRLECAGVLLEAFRERGYPLPLSREAAVEALMGAIRFQLYPDVLPALEALAGRGIRMGLISNWDCSLPETVASLGLDRHLDCVIVSALCGCEKPDPAIFREALRCAGARAEEAVHVGDSYENDVLGARSAGMAAILLDRKGEHPTADVPLARDLAEVVRIINVGG